MTQENRYTKFSEETNQTISSLRNLRKLEDTYKEKLSIRKMLIYLSIAGGLLSSSIYYNKGYNNGRVDLLVEQEFEKTYVPKEGQISDPIASRIFEMREAFVNGKIVENPYYTNKGQLEDLVKEGDRLRDKLRKGEVK